MEQQYLVATVLVTKPIETVWEKWTTPKDIKQWNIPFENWHCPEVENNVWDGGDFCFKMEIKDGSDGFYHKGKYDKVVSMQCIEYTLDDGRKSCIEFQQIDNNTIVREKFEPEMQAPSDLQQEFCQSVLERFKKYVEGE